MHIEHESVCALERPRCERLQPRARRVDLERMSWLPPVTLTIIGLLATVFLLELAAGSLSSREAIESAGALVRDAVLDGEYWRLVSATLMHAGVLHLAGNAVALYVLGVMCEPAFGRRPLVVLYSLAALAGSLASLALHPGPSVGASGAIFGLQGAVIVLLVRHRHELPLRDARVGTALLGWTMLALVAGIQSPYVDSGAHLGGALGGAATARWLHPAGQSRPSKAYVLVIAALFWLVIAGVLGTLVGWFYPE